MRQTLFTIDHYLFENHWILIGWVVIGLAFLAFQMMRGNKAEAWSFLPVFAIGAALIYFVFPNLETMGVDAENPNGPLVPAGLAVQGYGLFLLLAMTAGFGLALYRAHQVGIDGDKILSLGFWMILIGLVGARAFYVIQKFENYSDLEFSSLIFKMINMTSGGLVVYGSLIGGILAAVVFLAVNKMPWRTVADVMAPGMVIGLAIGRLGCLMNGCCYGGVCEAEFPGIYFPAGSAPYVDQLQSGKLLGVEGQFDEHKGMITVDSVVAGSIAETSHVRPGDQIRVFLTHEQADDPVLRLRAAKNGHEEMQINAVIDVNQNNGETEKAIFIPGSQLPNRSLKTHPTQIYSSINATLLCAFLWFYFPYRRNTGEVFAWLLLVYPVGRFILEMIRRDELGQFGTEFTISQWVSFGVFSLGVVMMAYVQLVPEPAGKSKKSIED